MRKTFSNYENCLTNFTATIEKYFDLQPTHEILENLSCKLKQKKYENVVVIVVDGLGANSFKRNLEDNTFLRCNKIAELSSTFPASSVPTNISLKTGLNPIEHGIINEEITLKKNADVEENSIVTRINNDKKAKAYEFSKTSGKKYKDLEDLLEKIKALLEKPGKKYIYANYSELDNIIKEYGCDSAEAIKELKNINKLIEKFSKKLNDTVVFVMSNHGYLDSTPVLLTRYKDVYNMLESKALIEPRACHFFIKEGKKLDFEQAFFKYFVNDFILLSKNEAKAKDIFGIGTDHSLLEDPIGDYIAVGMSDKYFVDDKNKEVASMSSGITEDEMFIPLIMIDKK